MLASNESKAFSVSEITKELSGSKIQERSDYAKAVMNNLRMKLDDAGNGFMSIKENADGTYSFETLWSNKFATRATSEPTFAAVPTMQ